MQTTSRSPVREATPEPGQKVALFSGGGSGGHVFPGLAVAAELEKRGWRVDWAGRRGAMEEKLVARRGLRFHGLKARPVVGRGPLGKAAAVVTLLGSAWSARRLARSLDARVILGTGGYASAPAVLGGRLAGVPAMLLEPNAEPGAANRLLSRWAAEAALAHEGTTGLRCPTVTTGVPVREEFFDVAENLPFGSPLRVLVLGGSQGALRLNEKLPRALSLLAESLGPMVVRHQCGKKHSRATREAYRQLGFPVIDVEGGGYRPDGERVQVEVVSFLHDVAGAMAESHLIVSRAGAITLAEICAAGRACLLLPLGLAGGHQQHNARRLVEAGAAETLSDESSAEELAETLQDLLGDVPRLGRMASRARELGRANAAAHIADRLEHWGRQDGDPPAKSGKEAEAC